MAINRFTKYTAPQFVQAYDPYPIEKLLPLAQHQQKRFDAIDAAIGKAEADSVIMPGLSKESKETAAAINKERKQQLQDISNRFYESRNVRQAMRDLSGLSSTWANDPRVKFVESDAALKDLVLKNMADPDFGTTKIYEKLNPNTGEFTLGLTPEQIAAGMTVTPETYNFISNPGRHTAFEWIHKSIEPDVLKRRELQVKPDGKGSYYTYEGKALTLDNIMGKGLPSIQSLSSDGINLDQFESTEPELVKYIEFQKAKNPNYGVANLINDFAQDAKLYTYWQGFSNEGGTAQTGGTVTKPSNVAQGPSLYNSSEGLAYTKTQSEAYEKVVNEKISKNGLGGDDGLLNYVIQDFQFTDRNKGIQYLSETGLFDAEFTKEDRKAFYDQMLEQELNRPSLNQKITKLVNGKEVVSNEFSDEAKMQRAKREADARFNVAMNLRSQAVQTKNQLRGKFKQEDVVNGIPQITPAQQEAVTRDVNRKSAETISPMLGDIFNIAALTDQATIADPNTIMKYGFFPEDIIINGKQMPSVSMTSFQPIEEQIANREKAIIQALGPNSKIVQAYRNGFDENFITENINDIITEMGSIEGTVTEQQWVNTPVGGTSVSNSKKQNYRDFVVGIQNDAQQKAFKKYSINTEFIDALDANVKTAYGEREYVNDMIELDITVDPSRTDKTKNPKHMLIAETAVKRADDIEQPVRIFKDGANIVSKNDIYNSFADLPEDLEKNIKFEPEYLMFDYNDVQSSDGNSRPYSVYVKGKYTVTKDGEKQATQEDFDIDVTDQFLQNSEFYLNPKERAYVGFSDMINDKIFNLDAFGNESFLPESVVTKMSEVADDNFNLFISKNSDNSYNINGSTVLWTPGIDGASENATIQSIENLPNATDFQNLTLQQAKQKIIPMISDIYDAYSSLQTSETESQIPMNYQEYQPVIDNLKATGQINNPDEIESFNVGLFGLNDRNIYQNSGVQSEIGFISANQSPIAPANMSHEQNIEFAARTVANTKIGEKNGGWNNWDVVKRKDAKFVSDVQKLQNIFEESLDEDGNRDVNTLKANIEDKFTEIENASVNDNRLVDVVYSQFSQMSSYRAAKGNGTIETNINDSNIPDWMYAIAVILNESNANPDSVKANLYK